MKKNIHPEYRPVVFMDTSTGTRFMLNSTIRAKETTKWEDGNEYPLVKVEISAHSHPFYTGKMKFVDSAGRAGNCVRPFVLLIVDFHAVPDKLLLQGGGHVSCT